MATVLQHLGRVCAEVRRDAGVRQLEVAGTAGVSHTIASRFELGTGLPRSLDALINAYAVECGADPMDLWTRALQRWHTEHP
jgi:transcriptional regulator with XRE-family HTH domain